MGGPELGLLLGRGEPTLYGGPVQSYEVSLDLFLGGAARRKVDVPARESWGASTSRIQWVLRIGYCYIWFRGVYITFRGASVEAHALHAVREVGRRKSETASPRFTQLRLRRYIWVN